MIGYIIVDGKIYPIESEQDYDDNYSCGVCAYQNKGKCINKASPLYGESVTPTKLCGCSQIKLLEEVKNDSE